MKTLLAIFLVFISVSFRLIAANEADSIAILKAKIETLEDTEEKGKVLYRIAVKLNKLADADAITYANRSLELSKKIGYRKGAANAANLLGKIYYEYGDQKQALSNLLFAMRTFKEIGYWQGYRNSLNNIGSAYRNLKDLDKALWYFNRALLLNKALGDSDRMASNFNNIGIVLSDKNKKIEALSYFKQAYAIDTLLGTKDTYSISFSLNNLANIYEELNHYEEALAYSQENVKLTENANMFYNLELAYAAAGRIYIKKKNFKEGKKYCELALDLTIDHGLNEQRASLYHTLSEMYEAMGDTKQALFYHKNYYSLHDSLFNEQNMKQVHLMGILYETGIKDEQIKSLSKDKEIALTRADKDHLFMNFIIVISVLVIILGLIVARNLILKQRIKNKRLSEEKALSEIQKKRFERDNARLMHENIAAKYEVLKSKINPHFLFNSLATLSSIIPEESHEAEEYIEHFSDFYRKIIETTEVELLSLKDELKIVGTYLYLQQMAVGKNLVVEINIDDESKSLHVPPFAAQMIVENAIKHNEISSINPLKISISTQGKFLIIKNTIVRRTNEPQSTGIGEKNIRERYRLLSAQLPEFNDSGTEYIVRLPLLTGVEHIELVEEG